MKIIVAICGASGAAVAKCVIELLYKEGCEICVVASETGEKIFKSETGIALEDFLDLFEGIKKYNDNDFSVSIASGSNYFDAMIVVPCSAAAAGRFAACCGNSLISRVAEVALKEKRKLLLCYRESPMSTIQLENLLRLSRGGAIIQPISPIFYGGEFTYGGMVKTIAARILYSIGISTEAHCLYGGDGL